MSRGDFLACAGLFLLAACLIYGGSYAIEESTASWQGPWCAGHQRLYMGVEGLRCIDPSIIPAGSVSGPDPNATTDYSGATP